MNSYQRISAIKDLNKTIKEEQEEINTFKHNQENMINERDFYKNLLIQMDAWIKFLEQNHGNNNIISNNEKDKIIRKRKICYFFAKQSLILLLMKMINNYI